MLVDCIGRRRRDAVVVINSRLLIRMPLSLSPSREGKRGWRYKNGAFPSFMLRPHPVLLRIPLSLAAAHILSSAYQRVAGTADGDHLRKVADDRPTRQSPLFCFCHLLVASFAIDLKWRPWMHLDAAEKKSSAAFHAAVSLMTGAASVGGVYLSPLSTQYSPPPPPSHLSSSHAPTLDLR